MSDKQKQLVVFPRGQLDAKQKIMLSLEGFIAVEADDPRAIVTVLPMAKLMAQLEGDEVVRCMARGLLSNTTSYYTFGKAMAELIASKNKS